MPLKLRPSHEQFATAGWPPSEDHLSVSHAETVIGSLRREQGGPAHNQWFWSITALYTPPGTLTMNGRENSKEEAKAMFGKTLRKWLDLVGEPELTDAVIAKHRHGSGHNKSGPPKR